MTHINHREVLYIGLCVEFRFLPYILQLECGNIIGNGPFQVMVEWNNNEKEALKPLQYYLERFELLLVSPKRCIGMYIRIIQAVFTKGPVQHVFLINFLIFVIIIIIFHDLPSL